jgi:hypothetical protein
MRNRSAIPLIVCLAVVAFSRVSAFGQAFIHPGLLHTQTSLDRAKAQVDARAEPWLSGWNRLAANSHASAAWQARPSDTVYRGSGTPENYANLYTDIAAAYANALYWRLTGETAHAQATTRILDAWSAKLKAIDGSTDKYLAAGIYGYELANAVELMRGYPGWNGFPQIRDLLRNVFYPMNHDFLANHHGACISHYWANWDLVNMASMLAIGILADDRAIYDEAVAYFKTGAGNGSIRNVVWYLHPGGLGQWQEAGRDQGHSLLGPAIMGAFCEMAWSQGEDLYGYDDNRLLKGFEYVAKYNLGDSVPYAVYDNCDHVNQVAIAPDGRGELRPAWELIYNHYAGRKGLDAPYCRRYAEKVRPEGGGGDYGPNSGGYDQLGYGTLTATLATGTYLLPGKPGRATAAPLANPSLPTLDASGRLWPATRPTGGPSGAAEIRFRFPDSR